MAFRWQQQDMDQCRARYESGAPGHVNATGMGLGKTITVIAECLAILDGVFRAPALYTPCRDGTMSRNEQYDNLRGQIETLYREEQPSPRFANREAWTDRAWLYVCMGRTGPDVSELRGVRLEPTMLSRDQLIDVWRRRHERMYAHSTRRPTPEATDYSKLLVPKRPPVLVVCGTSFATEWFRELENLTPGSVRVLNLVCEYSGVFKYRRGRLVAREHEGGLVQEIAAGEYDFVFVTYDIVGNAYTSVYCAGNGARGGRGVRCGARRTRRKRRAGTHGGGPDDSLSHTMEEGTERVANDLLHEDAGHGAHESGVDAIGGCAALMSLCFSVVVVDEAHKACNRTTKRHNGVRFLKAFFKIFATATPIQNNISDLRDLLLAMNFEHCLLCDGVFQHAAHVRYTVQYSKMRQQYVRERSRHLMATRGRRLMKEYARQLATQSRHTRIRSKRCCQRLLEQRCRRVERSMVAAAQAEISEQACGVLAQCSRHELHAHIAKAYADSDPWTLRRTFVLIMSMRQGGGPVVDVGGVENGGTAVDARACSDPLERDAPPTICGQPQYITRRPRGRRRVVAWTTGRIPAFVYDDGRTIDPIMVVVRWFFHWESEETLRTHLVDHRCEMLRLQKSEHNASAVVTEEERSEIVRRMDVVDTTIRSEFMYDYEVEIYSAVCENTIALIEAVTAQRGARGSGAGRGGGLHSREMVNMHSALRVPITRMQQVCMHPAVLFLPSGENSTQSVEAARRMLLARLQLNARSTKECCDEADVVSEDSSGVCRWDCDSLYKVAEEEGGGSSPSHDTAAAAMEPADVTMDALAMHKNLLVPYGYFAKVVTPDRVIAEGTKETMLYQLFTNQLKEALADGDPRRLVTPHTKILVFDSYPMVQMLQQRAADRAFGRGSSVCISGEVPQKYRNAKLQQFRTDPSIRVLFLTLETGAHALNIHEGNIVVFTALWWNPAKEKHAMYRVLRPSRDHPVFVYRFMIKNTIEEHVVHKQNEKRQLIQTMLSYDEPLVGILGTNQHIRSLQRLDAYAMRQVATNAIASRTKIKLRFARSFIAHSERDCESGLGSSDRDTDGDESEEEGEAVHDLEASLRACVDSGCTELRNNVPAKRTRAHQAPQPEADVDVTIAPQADWVDSWDDVDVECLRSHATKRQRRHELL